MSDFGGLDAGVGQAAEAMPGKTVQVTGAPGKPVALDSARPSRSGEGGRKVGAGAGAALLD